VEQAVVVMLETQRHLEQSTRVVAAAGKEYLLAQAVQVLLSLNTLLL
jgi:hypothetical protein